MILVVVAVVPANPPTQFSHNLWLTLEKTKSKVLNGPLQPKIAEFPIPGITIAIIPAHQLVVLGTHLGKTIFINTSALGRTIRKLFKKALRKGVIL